MSVEGAPKEEINILSWFLVLDGARIAWAMRKYWRLSILNCLSRACEWENHLGVTGLVLPELPEAPEIQSPAQSRRKGQRIRNCEEVGYAAGEGTKWSSLAVAHRRARAVETRIGGGYGRIAIHPISCSRGAWKVGRVGSPERRGGGWRYLFLLFKPFHLLWPSIATRLCCNSWFICYIFRENQDIQKYQWKQMSLVVLMHMWRVGKGAPNDAQELEMGKVSSAAGLEWLALGMLYKHHNWYGGPIFILWRKAWMCVCKKGCWLNIIYDTWCLTHVYKVFLNQRQLQFIDFQNRKIPLPQDFIE